MLAAFPRYGKGSRVAVPALLVEVHRGCQRSRVPVAGEWGFTEPKSGGTAEDRFRPEGGTESGFLVFGGFIGPAGCDVRGPTVLARR